MYYNCENINDEFVRYQKTKEKEVWEDRVVTNAKHKMTVMIIMTRCYEVFVNLAAPISGTG